MTSVEAREGAGGEGRVMAEYVCDMTDDYPDVPYGSDEYSGTVERRERIVRCRDCKFSTSMGYQCEWFHGDYLTHAQVVPEGFCAWGERRGA